MAFSTKTAPGAAGYGNTAEGFSNTSVVMATSTDGRIFYNWWELGQGGHQWVELEGGGRTDAAPAVSFWVTGDIGVAISVFSAIKGLDSNIYYNGGKIGGTFNGWRQLPGLQTSFAPAATVSNTGNNALGEPPPVMVATALDGRIFYFHGWNDTGRGVYNWIELDGNGRTNAGPAAALVGGGSYLFVAVKGLDGNLYLNQGTLDKPFVGWGSMGFTSNVAPGATSSGNTSVVVATSTDGRIFYTWWKLGEGAQPWRELEGNGRTDAAPAAALVGDSTYLFVAVKGLDGNLYLNQGVLGKPFVGWQQMQ